MDYFTQSLKAQVEKALGQTQPWGDVNPLVVIGLTEAILDLGLTEDQFYTTIRSYGRQLAAQVHPDRKPENVSPERQKQILGAFDLLDNRENFTHALANFKTLRAEDRREVRMLQQTNLALRHQIDRFEAQFDQLTAGKKALANEQREWEKHKKEEPLLVPNLERTIEEYKGLLKIEEQVSKRALSAENRVKNLERRLVEVTQKLPTLRKQISDLKETARVEKRLRRKEERLRREQERKLGYWARSSKRWQKRFEMSALLIVKLTAQIKRFKETAQAKKNKDKKAERAAQP